MLKDMHEEIENANKICDPTYRNCRRILKSGKESKISHKKSKPPPLFKTKFRDDLIRGALPFERDHSESMSNFCLAWKEEIQNQDLETLLPRLLDGYLDSEELTRRVACRAVQDIIQHAKSYALNNAIPFCILSMKAIMATQQEEVLFKLLRTLELWVTLVEGAAEQFSVFAHQIFAFARSVVEKETSSTACAVYGTWEITTLKDYIFKVMNLMEENSGDYDADTFYNLKLAVPTYQSPRFTGL